MTILEALERAKQLGRMQKANSPLPTDKLQTSHDDASPLATKRQPAFTEHFAALERVAFDLATCAISRILVTAEQLSAASHAAAAYRLLRSRVLHRIASGDWSCIGITSAAPGDGKTVTALNLAISIARDKQRMVYLLDLDMRSPSVWACLGCRPRHQLSQYFSEGLAPEQVLYETSVENLVVAGACDAMQGASELLASRRIDELLEHIRLRSPGALIIIDLPPVLSTDETLVVAPRTNALFLVVSEGFTRRDSLARTIDLLSDFTVAGIILNQSQEKFGTDYYGY